jgi:hypothetical protein
MKEVVRPPKNDAVACQIEAKKPAIPLRAVVPVVVPVV